VRFGDGMNETLIFIKEPSTFVAKEKKAIKNDGFVLASIARVPLRGFDVGGGL
jgi:hypothetical protein